MAPLGLTAGLESRRSGGGNGGLTILPRGPVPSNRHQPRCGSAGGSALTFPAGGASAPCPGPGGGGDDVGRGGKGGRKTGSAAAAEGRRRRWSRWSWSRRCQSRRSVTAVGPRQCPFLSPIVNITGRLSPWHTRNRTFWPTAPASGAHSLEASKGKQCLTGRLAPSLPCQHVRLRANQGLAAVGQRNRRVGRAETEDWTEERETRMQPRSLAAQLPLPPGGRRQSTQPLGLRGALNLGDVRLTDQWNGFPRNAELLGGGRLQSEDSKGLDGLRVGKPRGLVSALFSG